MSQQRTPELPPLRTLQITLADGTVEGLEGHRLFVDDSGALIVTRFVLTPFTQTGASDMYYKAYAPGTWYSAADLSSDFKSLYQGGMKLS